MPSNGNNKLYEFGLFHVDTSQRFLLCNDKPVHLSPKTFELLVFLIEHPNQVIDKERVMEDVWKDLFVEEANIAVHISTLRKALNGDGTNGVSIETFPKVGYRFNAVVSARSADSPNNVKDHSGRKYRIVSAAVVAGVGILVMGWIGYAYLNRANTPFHNFSVSKFTTSGDIVHQSISPDGKYVAYWKGGEWFSAVGKPKLRLKQIGTGRELELASPANGFDGPPTFSPDGKYVYYWEKPEPEKFILFKIALLGGEPIRLGVTNSYPGIPNISPDGRRIGTKGWTDVKGQTVIKVVNEDGTGERILATRQAPSYYTGSGPWSPDGRFIISSGKMAGEAIDKLIAVNVDDGMETIIPSGKLKGITGVSWLPDMSGLVMSASDEFSDASQIWLIAYPSGTAQRITNDTNNYFFSTMAADGKSITAIQDEHPGQIWSLTVSPELASGVDGKELIETADAKLISTNRVDGYSGVANAPDGKVIFTSSETGNIDIWSMNGDGTGRRQLTTDPQSDFNPSVCGDGRNVVFTSKRNGGEHAWVMDLDGGNQRQLTFGSVERVPVCSPDGQWVAYNGWDSGKLTIWKISINGGEPLQLTETGSSFPMFSPDSNLISYYFDNKIGVMRSSGGPPVKTFDLPKLAGESQEEFGWSPDGQSLILSGEEGGVGNLWIQPLDGELRKLTNFTSQKVWRYDWSKDGSQLLFSRGTPTRDIVLFSEAK